MPRTTAGRAAVLRGRRRECDVLGRLVDAVRAGESQALVLRGEPGAGKTALLDYLAGRASGCRVARAAGVQSEMELAYAGLHQLCGSMLDRLERLPAPQRAALRAAFGLSAGPAPERFLVALAVLGLLSEVAGERPLICLVDDEQWLDRASAQALGFVARRLAAESVGLVFATQLPGDDVAGLPGLVVAGLGIDDSRALLDSVVTGPLDARVRDQIVAETQGNPLALLELPRGLTSADLAGGFGLPGPRPLSGRIEETFGRRIDALPAGTRLLLQLAAADPSGDPLLVWRAAGRLGIALQAAAPAVEAGLVEFGAQVRFRHPLVRSAAYLSASSRDKQDMHGALAEVTDPRADPDRRAWHLAQAASGPDEGVAAELEQSADRAQARGGLAAAAAFLERAALLTPEPARRGHRLLAAARAKRAAGALDASLGLLVALEAGTLDEPQAAEVERLRGQIAFDQGRGADATRLLLSAARRFEPFNAGEARETHLEALWEAAMWAGDLEAPGSVREAALAARAAPPGPDPPRAVDVLLDALALRLTEGHQAAAPALARALELVLALDAGSGEAGRWLRLAGAIIAFELWDFESWRLLAARQVQVAREQGALVQLQFALNFIAVPHFLAGELATTARLLEEDRQIAVAVGNPTGAPNTMMLTAWQGRELQASEQIEATVREATAHGLGTVLSFAAYASSVLYNGLGQHAAALDAARRAFERDQLGCRPLILPELAEAAARTGDVALVRTALDWLSERTRTAPTEWSLGIEARIRALLSEGEGDGDGEGDGEGEGEGEAAGRLYRESIDRLARTPVRAELARAHLLYGEWLRRVRRRGEARDELRTACESLDAMGMEAFAERARRELLAAGETARKPTAVAVAAAELTGQEAQIAQLAREGLSNPQIAARLFISARTVQYHLGKVFSKLDISSRSQLDQALPGDGKSDAGNN
jgi:DNA-binding CsgD family transcriptional regulator